MRSQVRALVAACAVTAISLGSPSSAGELAPIRVLVFSQAYGYVHDSIRTGEKYLLGLNRKGYRVANTHKPSDLAAANLAHYDVLVWNNSTGNVPLSPAMKSGLLAWVRAGHGFVGVHSSGDSNYTWPGFAELSGGLYLAHLYKFSGGGILPDPTIAGIVHEDPTNPLMKGVPPDFRDMDETYRWQIDPRPDVHVLQSFDNVTVYEGAAYSYHSPLTWCRPFGAGRTWYTNLGHGAWEWSDKVFLRMLSNALQYTGGHLSADCSVPTDPNTGVAGAHRMEAVWADKVVGGSPEISTYSGGMSVLTKIVSGATLTWRKVNLTGANGIGMFASAQTLSPPNNNNALLGTTPQQRNTPTAGGTVEIRLDSVTGPVAATIGIVPVPGPVDHVNLPNQVKAAQGLLGQASWKVFSSSRFVAPAGTHDLILTFRGTEPSSYIGSVGWIDLLR